jgi:hypothetical protein
VNRTGSGMCLMLVFAFNHDEIFVSVTRKLVSSCFVSQIPVTVTYNVVSINRMTIYIYNVAQPRIWHRKYLSSATMAL